MEDRNLFKAKFDDSDKWVEGILVEISGECYIIPNYIFISIVFDSLATRVIKVKNETICQCTGIKDKNGKLIFENDIIKTRTFGFDPETFTTQIKFGARSGVQGFYLANGRSMFYFGQTNRSIMDDTEVIGNIFDNPELLKEGANHGQIG